MLRITRICQKPGRFLRFVRAMRSRRARHVCLRVLGVGYLERNARTGGRLDTAISAPVVVRRAPIWRSRVAADMIEV